MEIWIHAPKNFRPRDWVERLQDFDVVFGLDPYLVDPRFVSVDSEKREVLAVLCTLLDRGDKHDQARENLFKEMMSRAASLGLSVSVPATFPKSYSKWWEWLKSYCKDEEIPLDFHEGHSIHTT